MIADLGGIEALARQQVLDVPSLGDWLVDLDLECTAALARRRWPPWAVSMTPGHEITDLAPLAARARLECRLDMRHDLGRVYIRHVLTHAEYDRQTRCCILPPLHRRPRTC